MQNSKDVKDVLDEIQTGVFIAISVDLRSTMQNLVTNIRVKPTDR